MAESETRMWVLPPAPDKCQICGTTHEAELPHNAQSFFYQMTFNMAHNRAPTWIDAMAHCTPEMRAYWRGELMRRGVDVDGGAVNPAERENARG